MADTDTQQADAMRQRDLRKVLSAGMIGNVLEWYDFAIYGFLAHYIATSFFPSDDPLSSLLAAYGAFAAGFLARPLGGAIFGHIGDKWSRKRVLTLSIVLMGISTAGIGFLPTYDEVGVTAGVLLVLMRILQGISVGGELSGSIVFIAELAPKKRRGLLSSVPEFGSYVGFFLGSGLATLMSSLFSDAQMQDGLWRAAFFSGAIIMGLGVVLRSRLSIPESLEDKVTHTSPVVVAVTQHWRDILRVAGISASAAVTFYIMFTFGVSFLTDQVGIPNTRTMDIETSTLAVAMMFCLLGGYLVDRFDFKTVFLVLNVVLLVATYPLFKMFASPSIPSILFAQTVIAALNGIAFGASSLAMVQLAPKAVRVSVVSIGYNLAFALFGGTAPAVATYLLKRTGDDMVPAYYMMLFALVAIVSVLTIKSSTNARQDL